MTPAAEIDVIGHTDSRGAAHFNDLLGSIRARRVARMMEERGFDRSRLSVQSRGKREPVVQTLLGTRFQCPGFPPARE